LLLFFGEKKERIKRSFFSYGRIEEGRPFFSEKRETLSYDWDQGEEKKGIRSRRLLALL
jgi:hypothetical protein